MQLRLGIKEVTKYTTDELRVLKKAVQLTAKKLKLASITVYAATGLSPLDLLSDDDLCYTKIVKAIQLIKVYKNLMSLLGTINNSIIWLNSFNSILNSTPIELMTKQTSGLFRVLNYLESSVEK